MIDTHDLHWLAGLLEGEGSFVFHERPTSRQFLLTVVSIDKDTVERVAGLLGANCTGPYWAKLSTQPYWKTQLGRRDDVLRLLRQLRPLLSIRRKKQIDHMFAMHKAHPKRARGPRRGESPS